MKPILSVAEMRDVDAAAIARVGIETLVARAGSALAWAVRRRMGGTYGRRVVVVAGAGHNGDDARVAAAWLARWGARVVVVSAAGRGGRPPQIPPCELVIDAAYGTGFHGDYIAPVVPPGALVVAVDIPTGVDGDGGEACGDAVRADATVTFVALKPGLLVGEGRARSGEVEVAGIGLDASGARAHLVTDADLASLPERPAETHKWASALFVAAGSAGMLGAASLCSRAAMRAGAGMVRLGIPGMAPEGLPVGEVVASALPAQGWAAEVLGELRRCKALVIGPGLGRSEATADAVRALVVASPVPILLDADALAVVGSAAELGELVRSRGAARPLAGEAGGSLPGEAFGVLPGEAFGSLAGEAGGWVAGAAGASLAGEAAPPVLVTPHDGEFAGLAGHPPGADRFEAARWLARTSGATVLLKGPTTIVAAPDGRVLVSTSGSARLATAGTGDVLSGVIGAFLAQGVEVALAAALGAHVHGRAASRGLVCGLVAGDLVDLVAAELSCVRPSL
ncbi:MAG: bifunctional ADP-dependent NAD(P)H-hydrate dehydratase/NAD(P)H-hydrate epimerase [Acidimicrobiales bacterium]